MDKSFEEVSGELDILNAYAVNFRYPGEVATVEEANEAVLVMRKIHKFIRDRLKSERQKWICLDMIAQPVQPR